VDQRKICVNPYCPGTGDYHFPSINEMAAGFETGDNSITTGKKYSVSSAGLHV
jgi:hypothetical protein